MPHKNNSQQPTRRHMLTATSAALSFPAIVPPSVFGKSAPSNLIQVGQIGCGRIARASEIPGVLRNHAKARFVAVCDLDPVRVTDGKEMVESGYRKAIGADYKTDVRTFSSYKELLADKSIDAVCISTPDHWHAQPAMEAALAGKDVYVQKPASLTIAEGRQMADVLKQTGRILQVGSQQRSTEQFRFACELVRSGRLGKIREIYIGLPVDPPGGSATPMPVPANFNYDEWLGSTPTASYTEERVHPQSSDLKVRYSRPGWLRCEQFGAGMITGWGAHHVDIAHWALNLEQSGPVTVEALAEFPKSGLWDVHGRYQVRADYPNGTAVYISDQYPNGIKFLGEDGWLWVTRGEYRVGSLGPGKPRSEVLDASDLRWLAEGLRPSDVHLHTSPQNDHHLDWLTSIRTREQPAAPAETGHRSCSACLVAHASMKLGKKLNWDSKTERFSEDAANATIARPQRAPYGTSSVSKSPVVSRASS